MVVITKVMVAGDLVIIIGLEDHLHGGKGVVNTEDDQNNPV